MARLAIRMPKMSMTMTEGEVATWMVAVGDEVAEGDVVAEVMTDKVDMEVESTVAGVLVEIVHESGMVDVGEPIGWVEGEDTGGGFGDLLTEPEPEPKPEPEPEPEPDAVVARAPEPEPVPAALAEQPEPPEPAEPEEPAASTIPAAVPRARGLARQQGLDLATVTGTGPDGLIRVEDVEARATPTPAAAPAATPAKAMSQDRRTAVRRVVARTMVPSAAIPQFTVWREVHLDAADARRNGASWTTVLLRAYAAALRQVPELLSRWEDDGPTEAGVPSVALAVATDRGLLVPVFTEPDLGSEADVDAEARAVVAGAQRGKVDPAYMGIANASLSNLGGLGVDRFQALLTPPQASVLSLGSIARRPVAVPGGVGLALTVHAGLTVDHRVADGAHAAHLLQAFAVQLGPDTPA